MSEPTHEVAISPMTFLYDNDGNLEQITVDGEQFTRKAGKRTVLRVIELCTTEYYCTACNGYFDVDTDEKPRFCPWCGREVEQ